MTNTYLFRATLGGKPERPNRSLASGALMGIVAGALLGALASCVTGRSTKPIYPAASEGSSCTLLFDNQMSDSIWTFNGTTFMEVTIDGFSPTERRNLPTGKTTLKLASGSHEMTIRATWSGKNHHFNPIRVSFETEKGESYAIRFQAIGGLTKPGFDIRYTGWSTEKTAGWPLEVYVADPLLGALLHLGGAA